MTNRGPTSSLASRHSASRRWASLPLVAALAVGAAVFGVQAISAQEQPLRLPELPEVPFDYDAELPAHLLQNNFSAEFTRQSSAIENDNTPANNPITDEGATLGRVLFYERRLSANNTVSCASCHVQANGFSDPRVRSIGLSGGRTSRHSMSLVNARFFEPGSFFWDTRSPSLEDQVLRPIKDPLEMDTPLDTAVEIVASQSYYPPLFAAAFGDEEVTQGRMAQALAQFVRSMIAVNAPYDQGRSQVDSPLDDFPNFTEQENLGKRVFFTGNGRSVACADCHVSEAFINPATGPANNGLDRAGGDFGAFMATNDPADTTRFKVPSLRNIELSAPYMHDGRYPSLDVVISHYSTFVQPHPSLSEPLAQPGGAFNFNFTQAEGDALIAFLRTLTDAELAQGTAWADPFTGSLDVGAVAGSDGGAVAAPDGPEGAVSSTLVLGLLLGVICVVVVGGWIRQSRRQSA